MPDWDAGHFALWRPAKRLLLKRVIGDFHVHVIFEKRKIHTWARRRSGEAVDLTATEYELLRVLSLDAGCVATFETLRRPVWAKRDSADAKLVRIFARNQEPAAQARRQRGQPRLDGVAADLVTVLEHATTSTSSPSSHSLPRLTPQ